MQKLRNVFGEYFSLKAWQRLDHTDKVRSWFSFEKLIQIHWKAMNETPSVVLPNT